MPRRKTIHGIDPYAPGGIEQLIEHHRATFGDAVMEAEGGDGGDGGAGGDGSQQEQQQAEGAQPGEQQQATDWDGNVESLPEGAQKIIRELRKEDGDERVAKKTLEAIQKALNPDAKAGDKPDAEALTKALNDRATEAAEALQAKRELAVFRIAAKQGADADALLDSRAFLAKIADLDPTKTADLEKAIKDAVTSNPKLKSVLAAGASGADFNGGTGEKRTAPTTLTGALNKHYGA